MNEIVPETFEVTDNSRVEIGISINIDLSDMSVRDILTYVLNYLKELNFVDASFDYTLPFNNSFSLRSLENVLSTYNRVVKLNIINEDDLSEEEIKLLDLLRSYNSIWFSTSKKDNKFTKAKLNYRSASPVIKSKPGVKVKRSELVKLDKAMKDKCKQNALEREAGKALAKKFLVKSLIDK